MNFKQGKVVQNMMLIQKVILKNTGRRVKVCIVDAAVSYAVAFAI